MKIYFLVFLLTLLAQFIPVKDSKQYWWRTVCSFVPLFFFLSFRKDYGIDEEAYHDFFDWVHKVPWNQIFSVNEHMEPGYTVLNRIMPSYQSLITLISFINCWGLSFLIYRFVPSKFSWLAIILLFLTPSMTIFFMISGIRNGLAASLLLLGCFFIEKRKLLPTLILGAIAMSIHTSALFMFLVCYWLGTDKPITKRDLWMWSIMLMMASFSSLVSIAEAAMPFISTFMGRYEEQVEEFAEIGDERGFVGALLGIVLAVGIMIFQWNNNIKNVKSNKGLSVEYNSMKYKYALFYAFSFTLGMLGGRMGQYLIYFFIVSVVSMVAYWRERIFKYGYLVFVLYFFRITFLIWLSNPYFKYWTYTSILGDF